MVGSIAEEVNFFLQHNYFYIAALLDIYNSCAITCNTCSKLISVVKEYREEEFNY